MSPTARPWALTLTGQQFFYDNPESYPFTIREIAHVLSNICRFGGHLRTAHSVAHHSVLVARTVACDRGRNDLRLLRAALLHDAAEGFVGDIVRPLRAMPTMASHRELEDRTQRAILRTFGLEDLHEHDTVMRADTRVLEAEKRALWPSSAQRWVAQTDDDVSPVYVAPIFGEDARTLFEAMWESYGGEQEPER